MTSEQKVTLVETAKDTYGLNLALATIDLPKSTWYYHQKHKVAYEEKYADLFPILEEIARAHPEYGVPRIMPELRDEHHIDVNPLRVLVAGTRSWSGCWAYGTCPSCAAPTVPGQAVSKRPLPRPENWPTW